MANLQHPRSGQTITVPDDTVDSYIERGWRRPGEVAEMEWPTSDWRNADIEEFAEREGFNLAGARTKQEMLDAILAARAVEAG